MFQKQNKKSVVFTNFSYALFRFIITINIILYYMYYIFLQIVFPKNNRCYTSLSDVSATLTLGTEA